MADVVNKEARSRMMSGIRGKNTKPEILIRKKLHAEGYRYILHDSRLPGKPDLVFPKYHAVIFINGCFWHKHECHLFKWPSTNIEFWKNKITQTAITDKNNNLLLFKMGWRILEVWECAIKGIQKLPIDTIINEIDVWLPSESNHMSIRGKAKIEVK